MRSYTISILKGSGPRHFEISEKGDFMYILNEFANTVTAAQLKNGKFEIQSTDFTFKSKPKSMFFLTI